MIIARAPLRVSLAGGGTDLPWYARDWGTHLIAASIDKYVHIAVKRRTDDRLRVAYSTDESVDCAEDIKHPLLRRALAGRKGIELHSMADVPANSGLGSSGAFMVAVTAALDALDEEPSDPRDVAWRAFVVERREDPNTGWQDHAVAGCGGVRAYTAEPGMPYYSDAPVRVVGLDSLTLWDTGLRRKASEVLAVQAARVDAYGLHTIKAQVGRLLAGEHIGDVMRDHWAVKAPAQPLPIAALGRAISEAGCRGLKLVGAGGGGFFLVSQASPLAVDTMLALGLKQLPMRFGVPGVEVIRW